MSERRTKNISKSIKPRILLTNDDGYLSEGIKTLFKELSRVAEVVMVAPDREQSASSHSLTLNRPLRVNKLDNAHYIIDGTPTDCVMLALHLVYKGRKPDYIISGINHGANMGDDITYSGTVAAAIEGAILGIPSFAVSMSGYRPVDTMKNAARFIVRLLKVYDKLELEPSTFLNINFPRDNGKPYRKYEFTSQGFREYDDLIIEKTDPRGHAYYWIGGQPRWQKRKGSDFASISRGLVSITPMKLEFTDQPTRQRLMDKSVKI